MEHDAALRFEVDYDLSGLRFIRWSDNFLIDKNDPSHWSNSDIRYSDIKFDKISCREESLYEFENDEAALLAYEVME